MTGCIDSLQKSIVEILRTCPELSRVGIFRENALRDLECKFSSQGMGIVVKIPRPIEASKYAAGPAFSKISFSVSINVDRHSSLQTYSPTFIAELVSKKLHNASASISTGYGKILLDSANPWQSYKADSQSFEITLNFNTQSLIL